MDNDVEVDMADVVDHKADRPGGATSRGGRSVAPRREPSDQELLAEAGVEPIYSTSEAAEFFDRTNQWLYWGLREGVFTREDGTPVELERDGHPSTGRRRFTLPVIREIMLSTHRRGNLSQEELKTVMRRIKLAEAGIEWREREGWRYAHLGRNRWRWIHPDEAVKVKGEWRQRGSLSRVHR